MTDSTSPQDEVGALLRDVGSLQLRGGELVNTMIQFERLHSAVVALEREQDRWQQKFEAHSGLFDASNNGIVQSVMRVQELERENAVLREELADLEREARWPGGADDSERSRHATTLSAPPCAPERQSRERAEAEVVPVLRR